MDEEQYEVNGDMGRHNPDVNISSADADVYKVFTLFFFLEV